MPRRLSSLPVVAASLLALGVVVAPAAATTSAAQREVPPSVAVMTLPESFGAMERPPVELNHAAHTTALAVEGCTTCHVVEGAKLAPSFAAIRDVTDRDELMDRVHAACIGCHRSRTGADRRRGPLECSGCHARRPAGESQRAPMRWDYSLHGRHVQAFPEACDTCHHSYDEQQQKLVYVKGTEESCDTCHLAQAVGTTRSWTDAVHTACVGCHLRRATDGQSAGPVLCLGCHDAATVTTYPQLETPPRIVRGQPDRGWIGDEGSRTPLVLFDHLGHEPQVRFCSSCHHSSLRPCRECHTRAGAPEGGGVTLEEAYHRASSALSCVGCHHARTTVQDCAGCHRLLPAAASQRSCACCHVGPVRDAERLRDIPLPAAAVLELAPLPPSSDAFPEELKIGGLAADCGAAKLPHRRIVAKLDAATRALFAEATPDTCPSDPVEKQRHLQGLALATLVQGEAPTGRSGRPEYVVVVDSSDTDGAGGPAVDWGLPVEVPYRVLADLAGDGEVHTVVVRNGVVIHAPGTLNLGRTTRLANRAQRRALRALYRGCAIPGCGVRYDRCKLHHVIWWRHGGRTDLGNLLPVCAHHHTKIHDASWLLTLGPDRELSIQFPDGTIHNTGPPSRRAA